MTTSPAGLRSALAADIAGKLLAAGVDVDVIDTPRADPPVERPRIVLTIRQVIAPDVACPTRRVAFDVWAVTPKQDDTGPADDELDALLGALLDALDASPRTSWTTADRGVFAETHPAYRVDTERIAP